MPTSPPTITALPTPPRTSSPATFDVDADAFLGALPDFRDDLNAAAANVYANATGAAADAATASAAASTAASAATTALNAPATQATSSSTITLGGGSVSFVLAQTGKAFSVGQWVAVSDRANPATRWLAGAVSAYNSSTGAMTVDVAYYAGSGTGSSWAVHPTSPALGADGVSVNLAPQFDNSAKPASTAFVKNSGLQINNIRTLTGATTLSSSDLGGEIVCNGSTYTVTLPATTGLGLGAYGQMLLFSNVATGDTTVAGNGADVITCGINSSHSFVVKSGDRALLVLSSAGFWILVGGEASLKYSGSFGASIAPNGYQMLPTGYMRQWGTLTLVTSGVSVSTSFPVAFPNACRGVVLTPLSVVTAPSYLTAPPSVTGFTAAQGFNGATSYSYEAWGY